MRKTHVVLATLALAASASASIDLFFTSSADGTGLTNPARAFDPTTDVQMDASGTPPPYALNGAAGVNGTPTIAAGSGEWAYVWLKFNGERDNLKVEGMHVGVVAPTGGVTDMAWYVMDDLNGAHGSKRWDGPYTPASDPEYRQNPQICSGTASAGLRNVSDSSYDWNLYDRVSRTYLLGAVRFAPGHYDAELYVDPGAFITEDIGHPVLNVGSAHITPEPASTLLLGLASLLLRRR
jgi:hypothetical protein